jgi:5-(carboxyamino)imidazole ribonucleotide mutase
MELSSFMDSQAESSLVGQGSHRATVAVVMGSSSDWGTMRHTVERLSAFEVPVTARIVSAHRTPDLLASFAKEAEAAGIRVIIAGAGGAAHLPGMIAANTIIPVLGVPIKSQALNGVDSLLSIVQMPAGVPVLTLSIGEAGAKNAALAAIAILSLSDEKLRIRLQEFRAAQTADVLNVRLPEA